MGVGVRGVRGVRIRVDVRVDVRVCVDVDVDVRVGDGVGMEMEVEVRHVLVWLVQRMKPLEAVVATCKTGFRAGPFLIYRLARLALDDKFKACGEPFMSHCNSLMGPKKRAIFGRRLPGSGNRKYNFKRMSLYLG
jgi:hypothetical protein